MRLSSAQHTGDQVAANTIEPPFLSIVIPAYNEQDRIAPCLAEVGTWTATLPYPTEVILVDDGSTDATVATARAVRETCPQLRIIEVPHRGKANAVLAGLEASEGRYAGFCDVDLATPLSTWDECLAAFEDGADVAIASREGLDATRIGEPGYRHVMGRAFNLVIRALLLPGIHDTQCGFKFFTREALDLILPRCRLYRDATEVSRPRVTAFDVELLAIARRQDLRIAIIPVTWQYGAHTKVNPLTDTLQNLGDVLKVRWNASRGHYD
jgi:dolichyl-phosphate beta-glucosyltransferase